MQARATSLFYVNIGYYDGNCEDAASVLHESCGIPATAHVWRVHASLRLCRMRLAFAFDLVRPAIAWKLGV